MKLASFAYQGKTHVGIVEGDSAKPVTAYSSMIDLLADGASGFAKAAGSARAAIALKSVRLLAPVPRPPKVICIGLNYRDHAIESGMAIPETPVVFTKFPSNVISPGETVILPKNSEKPDYESELAFVIGKGGRHIKKENWLNHVAGYTCVNDVSARDWQLQTSQWVMGKAFDTFCPMGPWITTSDEIADPHKLGIKMTINGEVLQNSSTSQLIFDIPTLVAHLSSVFTLEPGDVVSTGTPPGVGLGHKPPRWLKPGDVMTVWIEGIGELTNPCEKESQATREVR